ncbi:MAG: hypothetical protein ACK4N5_24710, partial [Myxococcales bacterium]
RRLVLLAAAALVALAGCSKKSGTQKPKGLGQALASMPARALALAPDGGSVAFVADVKPPPEKSAPAGVFQGILTTVPMAGGTPRQLGGGVTTLEDGFRFSPDGRFIAYLQGFRFADQSGTLQIAPNPTGDARQLAEGAKFYRFSPDSKLLGYVAAGQLHLVELATFADRLVAHDVATFEFAPDASAMLIRRPVASGSDLLLAGTAAGAKPTKLGDGVGEYQFSPDGKVVAFTARQGSMEAPYALFLRDTAGGELRKLGEGVSNFYFSPDSRFIAFIDGVKVTRTFGDLQLASTTGGAARKLGENVVEVRWSPVSNAVGFRENHEDSAGRKRVVFKYATTTGEGSAKVVADGVASFVFSGDGRHLAYLQRVTKPMYSIDLHVQEVGADEGR